MPAFARPYRVPRANDNARVARPTDIVAPELEEMALRLLEARRGRAHRLAPPRAGALAASLLRPLLPKDGATLAELQRRWTDIVGEKLATMTEPEKLSRTAQGAVLTIRVHAAAAPFVQHQAPLIVERCNLAGAGLKGLQIRHGKLTGRPAPNIALLARPLDATEDGALVAGLDAIGDPKLRAALLRLGRAVKTR
jgi:hypothetical protein